MTIYVKSIKAVGIYGRYDIEQDFHEGINILFGANGAGKTTLLHIIANLLNGDYARFTFIAFKLIELNLSDGTSIVLRKQRNSEEEYQINIFLNGEELDQTILVNEVQKQEARLRAYERRRMATGIRERQRKLLDIEERLNQIERSNLPLPIKAAYFPAFRSMIEAWAATNNDYLLRYSPEKRVKRQQLRKTSFSRKIFGPFVPELNYPSPLEIEQGLSNEIAEAIINIKNSEKKYLGGILPNLFKALAEEVVATEEESETILEQINSLFQKLEEYPISGLPTLLELREAVALFEVDEETERSAARVLNTYKKALEKLVKSQKLAFLDIEKYLNSVNSLLEEKKIFISPDSYKYSEDFLLRNQVLVGINFNDETPYLKGISSALSSGERQLVTLIYAASHMSEQQVVLIDEPEISLHVDWQRLLLVKMSEQLGNRQIIACTHSPVIGAEYDEEQVREFKFKTTLMTIPSSIEDTLVKDLDNEEL
jgi:predicted ATP-binding protein involved in virulence